MIDNIKESIDFLYMVVNDTRYPEITWDSIETLKGYIYFLEEMSACSQSELRDWYEESLEEEK